MLKLLILLPFCHEIITVYIYTSSDMVYLKVFICFVCLFVVICLTRDFFNSFGDVTIASEGLRILTYAYGQ